MGGITDVETKDTPTPVCPLRDDQPVHKAPILRSPRLHLPFLCVLHLPDRSDQRTAVVYQVKESGRMYTARPDANTNANANVNQKELGVQKKGNKDHQTHH